MFCPQCLKEFIVVWPNTRQKYCNKKCMQAAYRLRNKDILTVRNRLYAKENYDKILLAKRKYNKSIKGKQHVKSWYLKHRSSIIYNILRILRNSSVARARHYSRQVAHKTLKKLRDRVCEVCSMENNKPLRVDCHHIDENPLNNNITNLKWLCSACHGRAHSKSIRTE